MITDRSNLTLERTPKRRFANGRLDNAAPGLMVTERNVTSGQRSLSLSFDGCINGRAERAGKPPGLPGKPHPFALHFTTRVSCR